MNKKHLNLLSLLALSFFVILGFSRCTPDACADIDCGVHGTCVENSVTGDVDCQCDEGWEGPACDTQTDPCANITCQNGGTCNNGVCECLAGYTGNNCETVTVSAYLGAWSVSENCNPGVNLPGVCAPLFQSYIATMAPNGTSLNSTLIINFWDIFGNSVVAGVNGNEVTIALQDPDSDGFTVQGNGTLSTVAVASTINFSYTVTDTNQTPACVQSCTATWTKQ